ncbi:hypothetical protein [Enterococcus sp. BWR-S5]|uniref:hypothetical protein n=1 Tax=Enterococcus sp. BWR-S5 TaxID=2787714 RepID=UPI0019234338|nr:hypothetical protein [Enterococcus sp. BWR-S5]MBL1224877.1 hypothetical protein [Enterococcus sp. BWR-S5]
MNKSLKLSLGIFSVITVAAAGFILGQQSIADEKKVYIADDNLRAEIVEQVKWNPETGEEEPIESELPTVAQMERLEQFNVGETQSLEGLQYAKNIKDLSFSMQLSDVVDFRPIGKIDSLEYFYGYASEEEGDEIVDISAFSELKNLKYLSLGYYIQVFDFSALSNLESLETVQVTGAGMVELPEVYVSRASREIVMRHPVTYATQFDGERSAIGMQVDAAGEPIGEVTAVLDGNKMTITAIDEATERIEFSFTASSENGGFGAQSNGAIPIIWY